MDRLTEHLRSSASHALCQGGSFLTRTEVTLPRPGPSASEESTDTLNSLSHKKKHQNLLPATTRAAFYTLLLTGEPKGNLPHLQLTAAVPSLQDRPSCKYWLEILIPTGDWQLSVIAGSTGARGVSLVPNSRQNKPKKKTMPPAYTAIPEPTEH